MGLSAVSAVPAEKRAKAFKRVELLLLIVLMLISFTSSFGAVQSLESSYIQGWVTDTRGNHLQNVTVLIQESSSGEFVGNTSTDISGYYNITVESKVSYNLYFILDYLNTTGYDYVPYLYRSITIENVSRPGNVSVSLFAGASIYIEGDMYFVEVGYPAKALTFNVLGDPSIYFGMRAYGDHNPLVMAGKLDPRCVIVPANISVKIQAQGRVLKPKLINQHFTVDDDGDNFYLSKGELVYADLWYPTLLRNLEIVDASVESTQEYLDSFPVRFYLQAEIRELEEARGLVDAAENALAVGSFDECVADLREAYLVSTNVRDLTESMLRDAQRSALVLIPVLALSSLVLIYFFTENNILKALGGFTTFMLLLNALFFIYPGYPLLNQSMLSEIAIISYLAFVSVFFLLKFLLGLGTTSRETLSLAGAMAVTFSIAKRNLRRRRLVSFLTFSSMLIFVASSFALTSSTLVYGYHAEPIQSIIKPPSEGLLIRNVPSPPLSGSIPFLPLPQSFIDWLSDKPNVTVIAPKVENRPSGSPLVYLEQHQQKIPVFGVLGILPSAEVKATGLDDALVASQGSRFLSDNDTNQVLISVGAAEQLNLNVGDNVTVKGYNFTIVGLLDDSKLDRIRDIDLESVKPKKVALALKPCESDEIIIMTWRTALSFSGLAKTEISRIDVLLEDSDVIQNLAREIVLEKDYTAWSSFKGRVSMITVGEYMEVKGIQQMFIPLVIVILNVAVVMGAYVYRRKKEMHVMSTLGLNPTHISAIFVAESLLLGVTSGILGYLLGLGMYRLLPLLPAELVVRQKVSVEWSIFALFLALFAATLGGVIPAIRASKLATPSLERKWKLKGKLRSADKTWQVALPISINQNDVHPFFQFLEQRLRMYENETITRIENVMVMKNSLRFDYTFRRSGGSSDIVLTRNKIDIVKKKGKEKFGAKLIVSTLDNTLHPRKFKSNVEDTVSFVRSLVLNWSDAQGRTKSRSGLS